jgi:hypothetical protein
VGVLLLCYAGGAAKGVFRGYFAIGCAVGFVLYECTAGRAVTAAVTGLLRLLWTPVGQLGKGFALICEKVGCRFVKSTKNQQKRKENVSNRLQKPIEKVYNKRRTQKEREDKWQKKQRKVQAYGPNLKNSLIVATPSC